MEMRSRFTPAQKAAVRAVLDATGGPDQAFRSIKSHLAIADVRQALKLQPIPYDQFLGSDSWLAGGGVLRWLCSVGTVADTTRGDFDFFFPSLHALNTTARAMLDQGFHLRGYRAHSRNIREYLYKTINEDKSAEIWDATGNLVPLTPAVVVRLRLVYLEFRSPQGDTLQLVASCHPTPLETIMRFDISICQLVLDNRDLSFGPWTWNDVLQNRFRAGAVSWPESTFRRMVKYARRGFMPYAKTALMVSTSTLAQLVTHAPRYLTRAGWESPRPRK